jgi:hypothetical protein
LKNPQELQFHESQGIGVDEGDEPIFRFHEPDRDSMINGTEVEDMYEKFGAVVQGSRVEFNLFLPDNTRDPSQYVRGGSPRIKQIHVRGDF